VYAIYFQYKKLPNALRVALKLDEQKLVEKVFLAAKNNNDM